VLSLREPVIIDLASHYKGQLTGKIEMIKSAVNSSRLIEFDYYYEKGESHRRVEPYVVIFQWSSWYVFGFCLERQDWRLFKLLRLQNLSLCGETFAPREIPPARQDFGLGFTDENRLVALFNKSERYKLIEQYGMNCYTETQDGLRLETGFTNREYMVSWLLGFGGRVKVLEPDYLAEDIKASAEGILSGYK
jgi:predicted DNA-binding transcriptional regulator YafY